MQFLRNQVHILHWLPLSLFKEHCILEFNLSSQAVWGKNYLKQTDKQMHDFLSPVHFWTGHYPLDALLLSQASSREQ